MEITVRLYATMRDAAQQPRISVTLPEIATVQTLREAIKTQYPNMAPHMKTAIIAVNRAFAELQETVSAGDEVAIFPPVSGGSGVCADE